MEKQIEEKHWDIVTRIVAKRLKEELDCLESIKRKMGLLDDDEGNEKGGECRASGTISRQNQED
jgi:hypothetical protein